MSFILDALKKSENKRRQKNTRLPRSIHEPASDKASGTRQLKILIVICLVVIIVLLVWLSRSAWQGYQPEITRSSELPVAQNQEKETRPQKIPDQIKTTSDIPPSARLPAAGAEQQKPAVIDSRPADLPIPRSEQKVYAFSQLPASIQQQIPELQMALHAYNRDHGASSMVQLNQRIYRQGDKISPTLKLETITPDGAIIRYDGYRFLLPRRNR